MIKSEVKEAEKQEYPYLVQDHETGSIWVVNHNSYSTGPNNAFLIVVVHNTISGRSCWHKGINKKILERDFKKYEGKVTMQNE